MNPEVKGLWGADGFLCRVIDLKHNISPGTSSLFITVLKTDSDMPIIIKSIMPKRNFTFRIQKVREGRLLKGEEFPSMMLIGKIIIIANLDVIRTTYIQDKLMDDITNALNNGGDIPQGFKPVGNSSINEDIIYTKIPLEDWFGND